MKPTDEELALFCAPADKPVHKSPYTTRAKYMCYDTRDGSGIIQDCQMIGTQTHITQSDDKRYVTVLMPVTDWMTADELKSKIAETLKDIDDSDDDNDNEKKESAYGTDAN